MGTFDGNFGLEEEEGGGALGLAHVSTLGQYV